MQYINTKMRQKSTKIDYPYSNSNSEMFHENLKRGKLYDAKHANNIG